jgi:endonuclease YncB( thermonuclease family)
MFDLFIAVALSTGPHGITVARSVPYACARTDRGDCTILHMPGGDQWYEGVMVRSGRATVTPRYAGPHRARLLEYQREAQAYHRGIWRQPRWIVSPTYHAPYYGSRCVNGRCQ